MAIAPAQDERMTRAAERVGGWAGAVAAAGWWALAFAASLLLYWPGLRAGYFSDDLLFFFNAPPPHWYDYFGMKGAAVHAYRPLEAVILTWIQQRFRFETLPIHLISLSAHAGLVCVVAAAARRVGLRWAGILAACIFMLVAQVGAPAVLGNDTMSQAASTFLGAASVLFLWLLWGNRAERDEGRGKTRYWLISVGLYTASLFFKETALGFFAAAMLVVCGIAWSEGGWLDRVKTAAKLAAPYVGATVVYLLARVHAGGAVSESGNYRIHVGANILRNLAEFSLAAFGPASTVDGAVAVALHQQLRLGIQIAGWLLVVCVVIAGVIASRRWRICAWLAAGAGASLFPAFLLTHVSELYLYNAIPFLAVIFGIALGGLWTAGLRGRAAALACACVLFTGEIYADRQKAELMADNGRRAGAIMAAIEGYLRAMPPDSEIWLVNPPGRAPEYSVFLLKGFDVVDLGTLRMGPIFGRPDVRVQVIEAAQERQLERRKNRLFLEPEGNAGVKPYLGDS